ncbi:uncharacterized protein LOC120432519 [Culex pipiens pallens]|uniref:uncharacterized protein LOC120432519 n=1 Tax=Culex pipiens pallens TaxID=42434 RepID=UPI001953FF14|nr:uncharacterized protein LOC120432519 [Culex pipiens pallens]
MDSDVPSRNPLSYCRLCLSQVNLLTVLDSSDDANQSPIKEVLQKLHHYTKVALLAKDFPCAICGVCKTQLNEFHAFRRNVVRNHNAVQIFRQTFGDEIERAEPEEEETYVEIIEDSQQLADLIREEYGDTMELKEVDVYHVNGELRTVVVKPDPDAKPPPPQQQQVRVAPKKTQPAGPVNILNKSKGQATSQPTRQNTQKTVFKPPPPGSVFTVFKCASCRAVFQSHENLIIHQRTENQCITQKVLPQSGPRKPPQTSPPKRPLSKASIPPQTQKLLFKCVSCSSSFVQEENLKQHQITCKPAALSRLDLSQITIKRTKLQENAADRMQCDHCQLTYKTLHNLNKHLIEVHKVMPRPTEKHICSLCNLSYSCYQDLQLHIRALHSIRCTTCAADNRQCSHKPPAAAAVGNGVGMVNKATT